MDLKIRKEEKFENIKKSNEIEFLYEKKCDEIKKIFIENNLNYLSSYFEVEYSNYKGGFSMIKLYFSDIERLIPPNYLNDSLIFFYLK